MIIKIFKISTKEMWIMRNKAALCEFINQEIGAIPYDKLTIDKLIKYLPKENYYRVK